MFKNEKQGSFIIMDSRCVLHPAPWGARMQNISQLTIVGAILKPPELSDSIICIVSCDWLTVVMAALLPP